VEKVRELGGIVQVRTSNIIENYGQKSLFLSVYDLKRVSGIGFFTVDLIRDQITVE